MNVSRTRRSFAKALLTALMILPCQALAKQNATEDPASYPNSWYRIALDANGRCTGGDGAGYGSGTWYSYPETGWYRQWFYNRPFDAGGQGHFQCNIYIRAIDTTQPTTVEISINWTAPQWSQFSTKQPPLPKDTPTASEETRYMLGRSLYRADNQFIKPGESNPTITVDQYCPEWVSLDIRGKNAYVYGGVLREVAEPASELDFGDAPDRYQTLLASDGARHTVVPGVYLGRGVDAEPDGKPGQAANNDDLDGTSDEDGVVFTSPLYPGEIATVEVTASTQGYLNTWIDFDQDGSFGGPDASKTSGSAGEQVFVDQLLTPGVNRLSFTVPPTARKGLTYARFRFNTHGLPAPFGPAADGEVEDYQVAIGKRLQPQMNSGRGGLKWSQTPQQFDPATPFIFNAWGQPSDLHLHQIAADDWRCDDDRPITGIQWYGSFEGWTQPALPLTKPLAFHLALWTDSAATKSNDSKAYHHPDILVWETYCTHWTWNVAGYHNDPRLPRDENAHTKSTAPGGLDTTFQFTCLLSQDEWFHPEPAVSDANATPTVYWLSIAAFYDPNTPVPAHPWAWTTRPQFFNAGAVQIESIEPIDPGRASWPPALADRWASGEAIESPIGVPWDYAFELLTNQDTNGRAANLSPVYRFWSDKLGAHFYTIDEAEKDRLIKDYPAVWTFEGVAFYAYPPDRAPVGSKPVYRFWSESKGRHFYSISEEEKQKLVQEHSKVWTLEGVAWYAFD